MTFNKPSRISPLVQLMVLINILAKSGQTTVHPGQARDMFGGEDAAWSVIIDVYSLYRISKQTKKMLLRYIPGKSAQAAVLPG